jgi:hypothetical protein
VNRRISNAIVVVTLCCAAAIAHAKELDQFTDRLSVLRYFAGGYRAISGAPGPQEVDHVLDARMDQLLDRLATRLRATAAVSFEARDQLVREAFQHRWLPELVTPYEEWIESEARVPLYRVRDKGIYGNAVDFDDMRMAWYMYLSGTLQVAGVVMGTDKLGHFLGQGFQYYERYTRLDPKLSEAARCAEVRERGHLQEVGQLGIATGGVYSFADLAANWQGMLFFMALFEDVAIEGQHHARYLVRGEDGAYRRVRDFHWAEYVTPDWDEVLNPTGTERRALYDKVVDNMWRKQGSKRQSICDAYRSDPEDFLGRQRTLQPRESYSVPSEGTRAAPYSLDVQVICRAPTGRPAIKAR